MLTKQYKPYASHRDVKCGDIVMFKCVRKPKDDVLRLGYNLRQWWRVKEIHFDSIVIRKIGTDRIIEMVLHDYKIHDHVFELKPSECEKAYSFDMSYAEEFHLRSIITEIFSTIKKKFLSWFPFLK